MEQQPRSSLPRDAGGHPSDEAKRARRRRHAARHALLFHTRPRAKHIWIAAAVLFVAAGLIAGVLLFTDFDVAEITRTVTGWVAGLNPIAVIPLMALLPVAGFPIAIVYVVAGARFGPLGGGVVVAVVTAFHLLATHAVARSILRGPIERFVHRRHKRLPEIPQDEHFAVALIAALVPGLPYFVRNYLLALSGLRLKIYFWTCLPIYVARSYVAIMLGDLSGDPSRNGLFVLIVVDVAKVLICGGVIWWLRWHHRKVHGHDHDAFHGGDSRPPIAATR